MNTIKTLIVAVALSALFAGFARGAETVKPLQAVSFHTETKVAVAYYLVEQRTCSVVLTLTDKTVYAPSRFEAAVGAGKAMLYTIDDGNALEFACQNEAQAMSITLLAKAKSAINCTRGVACPIIWQRNRHRR